MKDNLKKRYLDSKKINREQTEKGNEAWIDIIYKRIEEPLLDNNWSKTRIRDVAVRSWKKFQQRVKNGEYKNSREDFYKWLNG